MRFELVGEKRIPSLSWDVRTYLVWDDDENPCDRFKVFRKLGEAIWFAWTVDTLDEKRREARRAFAQTLTA